MSESSAYRFSPNYIASILSQSFLVFIFLFGAKYRTVVDIVKVPLL